MPHCFALNPFYFSGCQCGEAEAALCEPDQAERMRRFGGDRARGGGSLHTETPFSQKAAKVKATVGVNWRAVHAGLRIQVRNCLKSPSSYSAVRDEPRSLQTHAKCKLVAPLGTGGEFSHLVGNQ